MYYKNIIEFKKCRIIDFTILGEEGEIAARQTFELRHFLAHKNNLNSNIEKVGPRNKFKFWEEKLPDPLHTASYKC